MNRLSDTEAHLAMVDAVERTCELSLEALAKNYPDSINDFCNLLKALYWRGYDAGKAGEPQEKP